MSPIRFVGLIIALVGYLAGALLVAQPFVPSLEVSPLVLAFLVPACLGIGLPLLATGARRSQALQICGWGLLLLGLAALLGIFASASGVAPASSTLLLWLIAPTGIFAGLLLTYFAGALDRLQAEGRVPD